MHIDDFAPDNKDCTLDEFASGLAAALAERDFETRLHCDRVVDIAMAIGRRCGFSETELSLLWLSAAFHDVGKIGIPDHVLRKPGELTEEEWEIMKTHTLVGEKIMRAVKAPGMEWVAAAVRHHHEHFDGSGYPDGLEAGEIPLMARIVAIADGYDAMLTARPYHSALSHSEVMAQMQTEAGDKYDPQLFGDFQAVLIALRDESN
jgi:HD-GYP domain-containing protein (c-di-GMP phosphodiesterase class II)